MVIEITHVGVAEFWIGRSIGYFKARWTLYLCNMADRNCMRESNDKSRWRTFLFLQVYVQP